MNDLDDYSLGVFGDSLRIAVVGGGVSGLVAAYRLATRHDVTLFEADAEIGGHVATTDVVWEGERHAIDAGFIVFNERNYPRFVRLLGELGVASRPTTMGFSVRCDDANLEYSGESLRGLVAQRRNLVRPWFWTMVRDILRFNREASRGADAGGFDDLQTVGEFLAAGRFSEAFAQYYLFPMGSAIWSCPLSAFADFPVRFVAEFFRNHGLLSLSDRPQWRVIEGGSRTYVRALLQRFRGAVRANTPIRRITRKSDGVVVAPANGPAERFDHVVIACHADQALRLLDDPTPRERQTLGAFPYHANRAVLHTDASVLPRRRRAWASWNYRLDRRSPGGATVTYCMNILQGLKSRYVFNVTLNDAAIDPAKIVREFTFHHPMFSASRSRALARFPELTNANRTSFCGAYWGNGFHEDGVASAEAVCEAIGRGLVRRRQEPVRP
jgi:predicted NAD/FAD-binding protein